MLIIVNVVPITRPRYLHNPDLRWQAWSVQCARWSCYLYSQTARLDALVSISGPRVACTRSNMLEVMSQVQWKMMEMKQLDGGAEIPGPQAVSMSL